MFLQYCSFAKTLTMYKHIIRPLLFKLSPERIHSLVAGAIKTSFRIPGFKFLVSSLFSKSSPILEREVFGLKFKNPIGLAAGFDKNAELYKDFSAFGFGFIEVGTITPKPQPGNPKPRSFRLVKDKALVNRMGFNNKGLNSAKSKLSKRKPSNVVVGGNIGKNTATPNELAINDYILCFKEIYNHVDYFVVNISCPNIANLRDLQDRDSLRNILQTICTYRNEQAQYRPVLLKISPDLSFSQIDETIEIVMSVGVDGIVATNTTTSRSNLVTPPEKVTKIGNGGLSGSPLSNRSTEVIRHIHHKTQGKLPIIASGGVMGPTDAIEKLEAGASLVQVYTGFIYEGPEIVKQICNAIINSKQL
jgi:dihydroorotate dehydrogenase